MTDKRKSDRIVFEPGLGVHVVSLDGTWASECTMLDISEGGVLLQSETPLDRSVIGEFFLSLTNDGKAFRRCELSWINGTRIGARFVVQERIRRKMVHARA